MNAGRIATLVVSLLSGVVLGGERIWPTPFETCSNVVFPIRPNGNRESSTIVQQLGLELSLLRPSGLDAFSQSNSLPPTVTLRFGSGIESCYYKRSGSGYKVDSCTFESANAVKVTHLSAIVPGINNYPEGSLTIRAKLAAVAPCGDGRTPIKEKFRLGAKPVLDEWNVVLDEALIAEQEIEAVASRLTTTFGGSIRWTFKIPYGFVLRANQRTARAIATDAAVRFVESAEEVRGHSSRPTAATGALAPGAWAYDRVDQPRREQSDGTYRWPEPRVASTSLPRVWVIDTTVLAHQAFLTINSRSVNARAGGDCPTPYHGTEVASALVGAIGTGQTSISEAIFVRAFGQGPTMFDCTSSISTELEAAVRQVRANVRPRDIVNMSFGLKTPTATFEMVVQDIIAQGAVVFASAGNEPRPVFESPANIPRVIAIGATDPQFGDPNAPSEVAASFSSNGPLVRFWAPGHEVLVATGPLASDFRLQKGTSIAAPIAAGIAVHSAATTIGVGPQVTDALLDRLDADAVSSGNLGSLILQRAPPEDFLTAPLPNGVGQFTTSVVWANDSIWLGSGVVGANSLVRVPVVNGVPNVAGVQALRSAEKCTSVFAMPYAFPTAGPSVMAGCTDGTISRLIHYRPDGTSPNGAGEQFSPSLIPAFGASARVPQIGTPPYAVAVQTFNRAAGDKVEVAILGGPFTSTMRTVSLSPSLPGADIRASGVAAECPNADSASCVAFVLVSERSNWNYKVGVWKIPFTLTTPATSGGTWGIMVGAATQVDAVQKTLDPFQMCTVPGVAFGVGMFGSGVSIRADGQFVFAISELRTADLGGGCQFAGATSSILQGREFSRTPIGTTVNQWSGSPKATTLVFGGSTLAAVVNTSTPVVMSATGGLQFRSRLSVPSNSTSGLLGAVNQDDDTRSMVLETDANGQASIHVYAQ